MLTRIRLTYKQNRFEVAASLLLALAIGAAVAYVIFRFNSVVFPAGCALNPSFSGPIAVAPPIAVGDGSTPSGADYACQHAMDEFNAVRYGTPMHLVQLFLFLGPYILAIMLGAPLVAREVEQNTAPLSWSLIGSRRRWLVARVAAALLVLVPLLVALGLAGDLLQGASNPGVSPWQSFQNYLLRGMPVVAWGLVAFALALALGTVLARTLPAIFLAVVLTLFVTVAGGWAIERFVLKPFDRPLLTWDQLTTDGGDTWIPDAMTVDWQTYLDGKPWNGDAGQWWATHQPPTDDPSVNMAVWGPRDLPIGFSPDQYWPIVLGESAIVVAGAAVFIGLAFYRIDRRRPY